MNFEEFCTYVQENIKNYLPDHYANYKVSLGTTVKVNLGERVGLSLVSPSSKVSRVQYLNEFYDVYTAGIPLQKIMEEIAETTLNYEKERGRDGELENSAIRLSEFSEVKDRIILCAVGVSYNKELLERVPHQIQGDIAAVYRIMIEHSIDGMTSALITNPIMEHYNVTQEQLHEIAVRNSMRAMPAKLASMESMFQEMGCNTIVDEIRNEPVPMCIITNVQKFYGAGVAFYPHFFEDLGLPIEKFYVIPSSIHEYMLVPKELGLELVNEMIRDVNSNIVSPEERLSDMAHEYDPQTKQLVIGGTLLKQELQQEEPEQLHDFGMPAYTM